MEMDYTQHRIKCAHVGHSDPNYTRAQREQRWRRRKWTLRGAHDVARQRGGRGTLTCLHWRESRRALNWKNPTCHSLSDSLVLKLEGSHLPKEGRSVRQCPWSSLGAEISYLSLVLTQHLQLNRHLKKQPGSEARSRPLWAQRQPLSQPGRLAGAQAAPVAPSARQTTCFICTDTFLAHRIVLEQKLFISAPFGAAVLGLQ